MILRTWSGSRVDTKDKGWRIVGPVLMGWLRYFRDTWWFYFRQWLLPAGWLLVTRDNVPPAGSIVGYFLWSIPYAIPPSHPYYEYELHTVIQAWPSETLRDHLHTPGMPEKWLAVARQILQARGQ